MSRRLWRNCSLPVLAVFKYKITTHVLKSLAVNMEILHINLSSICS